MKEYFYKSNQDIKLFLNEYFKEKQKLLEMVNKRWGREIGNSFLDFVKQGKMIRGGLLTLGYNTFSKKKSNGQVIKAAAAVEIMHSSLLIHDDIMDRDTMRRGQPTMHQHYSNIGRKDGLKDFNQFGLSAGICLGDIGFFLSQEIISSLKVSYEMLQKINNFFVNEVIKVGNAQLFEMYHSISSKNISREKIYSIYLHKTARYTFSMPLIMGAMMSGSSQSEIKKLEKLGEYMGMVFQIHDDVLGIFGRENITGKNIGSDIKESKKTLFYQEIFGGRKYKDKAELQKIFKQNKISKQDIIKAQKMIMDSGIYDRVMDQQDKFTKQADKIIQSIKVSPKIKKIYQELLTYNQQRIK